MQELPSDDAFSLAISAELGNGSKCLAGYGSHCQLSINTYSEVFWNITNADTNQAYGNGSLGKLLPGLYAVVLSANAPNDTSESTASAFMINPVGAKSNTGNVIGRCRSKREPHLLSLYQRRGCSLDELRERQIRAIPTRCHRK